MSCTNPPVKLSSCPHHSCCLHQSLCLGDAGFHFCLLSPLLLDSGIDLDDFPLGGTAMDLPPLCLRPSAADLFSIITRLEIAPRVWNYHRRLQVTQEDRKRLVVAKSTQQRREEFEFLSSLVRSPLAWIGDADVQEEIWTLASKRIAERCGRTG